MSPRGPLPWGSEALLLWGSSAQTGSACMEVNPLMSQGHLPLWMQSKVFVLLFKNPLLFPSHKLARFKVEAFQKIQSQKRLPQSCACCWSG